MTFPIPVLIVLQMLLHDLSMTGGWDRFAGPADGLSAQALRRYTPRSQGMLKLVIYIKAGNDWQPPGMPDDARWSGYRTVDGEACRYAQARVSVGDPLRQAGRRGESGNLSEAGFIDNIPTTIPEACLPDYAPVLEFSRWLDETPAIALRYVHPLAGFSPALVADSEPSSPGKEGDFGTVFIDANGFRKTQQGLDLAGSGGVTPVLAAALGRVILVAREGERKATAIDPGSGALIPEFPAGAPDKGTPLVGYGKCVYVTHPDGYTIRYAHLGSIDVEIGQGVLPGTRIGTAGGEGDRGWVHLEVRWGDPLGGADSLPVNPWEFFKRVSPSAPPTGKHQ
ncbi:MAG: M23 family metallopeptidase [Candidatus Aureabacteria bacterium]|nr:M23 family metallopeptidase [Candidatus Auribacterota bacterium]